MVPSPSSPACPLCGAADHVPVKQFADGVLVARCASCGFVHTPRPHPEPHSVLAPASVEELETFYGPVLQGERPHYRRDVFRRYLDILEPHAGGRRLLDVGCAHGFFGREARGRGFQVTGVEPHPGMAEFARRHNGLDVLTGRLDEVALGQRVFDVVTFTDSLEYMPDPVGAVGKVTEHLQPGGIVFIKVPNGRASWVRHRLGRAGGLLGGGEAFGPSMRVSHFDEESLPRLAAAAGLDPVEVGTPPPIHSPSPSARRQGWREVAPRWHEGLMERLVRRGVHAAGVMQRAVRGRNDLGQSLYVVARRKPLPEK